VRKETSLPLAVGFGIAGPEQAKRVARVADGVIVGSRIVQLIKDDPGLGKLGEFVRGLRAALDSAI
jgi:tryptophan synthase alpha chain